MNMAMCVILNNNNCKTPIREFCAKFYCVALSKRTPRRYAEWLCETFDQNPTWHYSNPTICFSLPIKDPSFFCLSTSGTTILPKSPKLLVGLNPSGNMSLLASNEHSVGLAQYTCSIISLNFTQRPSAADLSAASDITNATSPSIPVHGTAESSTSDLQKASVSVTYASKYRERKKSNGMSAFPVKSAMKIENIEQCLNAIIK